MAEELDIGRLTQKAKEIRISILESINHAASGHSGGSMGVVEILVTLYYHVMKHDPKNTKWPERDRFILSKGHCAPAQYAVLADCGYFPKEDLKNLRKLKHHLQGHPNHNKTPGIEATTGSLGQGLSITLGMALGAKLRGEHHYYYVLCGDGETQEGQIWEAALFANKYKLDHVIAFIDRNRFQQNDETEKIMPIEPVRPKWEAFGWNVYEVDGHDIEQITETVERAKENKGKPTMIIANTVKGKGISFMENQPGWHGKSTDSEELIKAIKEVEDGV